MKRLFLYAPTGLGVLFLIMLWHLSVGAKPIPVATVLKALLFFEPQIFDHLVVRDLRLPRALFAVLSGAALAVSGALMQGLSRNLLASPGILGLLSGASFAVVLCVGVLGWSSAVSIAPAAAAGALLTALTVWLIASAAPGGATPLVLVLSGALMASFLSALIATVHLVNAASFEALRIWLSGSLSGQKMEVLYWTWPWIAAGFIIAFAIARQLTVLSLGDDSAAGLGVNPHIIRSIALVAVILLTAGAVALTGPLGFIGLVIPHAVRLILGSDYRFIVPYSALLGALYLLLVDIGARTLFAPFEISTGIMTAALGAPCFIWLIRTRL